MVNYMFSSDQGNQQNEDAVFANEQFAFVIDGASGLYQEKITDYPSDAQWFSHGLAGLLRESLSDPTKSLELLVQEACGQLYAEYQVLLKKQGKELDGEMLPNATLSIIRLQKSANQLELFQLGDSPIVIESQGRVTVYDDQRLGASDQRALDEIFRVASEQQVSIKAARPFVNELLKENRRLRNTEKGYWILDPTGIGIKGAKKASLPLSQMTRLAIMSDGFWEAYDIFKQYQTPAELLATLFEPTGIKSVLEKLRAAQIADQEYNAYPRFKLMDDATIVLIEI